MLEQGWKKRVVRKDDRETKKLIEAFEHKVNLIKAKREADFKKRKEAEKWDKKQEKKERVEMQKQIGITQDLLFSDYGLVEEDGLKESEDRQLRAIEIELKRGNLGNASQFFFEFLQNAYDGSHGLTGAKATHMWAIRHYREISGGTIMGKADELAQKILDEHDKFFGVASEKKKKEELEDSPFKVRDLDKMEELYEEWKSNRSNKTDMKYFLSFIEDSISESQYNNNYMGVKI